VRRTARDLRAFVGRLRGLPRLRANFCLAAVTF
jgi:hypothetical protein